MSNSSAEHRFTDVICLSHLRWNFVYQRPQHIMSRFGSVARVFYFEEPVFVDADTHLDIVHRERSIYVATPHISHTDRENGDIVSIQREMLDTMIDGNAVENYLLWHYTPMAYEFSSHLTPAIRVFDCMDELSAFKFAPPQLLENERLLIESANLVFTGGQSLYEAKRDRHPKVYAFPSSIDVAHFSPARTIREEPQDQAAIPHPRFGFCGVIDERFDTELLAELAGLRPDWQFVMVGPVVKITEADLPKAHNIHYLGGKDYKDLPKYFSGWDVAIMPFAMNESTRYISPTKTPEYLAAGLPVISTPVRDVVRPYGENNLVSIAETAEQFVKAGETILNAERSDWLNRVDEFLKDISWDKTWQGMTLLINEELAEAQANEPKASVTASGAI